MTLWLLVPLFALAQASCYDYEYYDPTTGSSLPGNACAKAGATATTGQPVAAATTTTFSGSLATAPVVGATTYSAPVYGTPVAATTYTAPASTVYGTPIASSSIYGTPLTTTVAASTPVYGTPIATSAITARTVATPIYGTTTTTVAAARPAAVTVSAGAARGAAPQVGANGQTELSQQQIAYYKRLGEQQQRDHKYNQRVVKQANNLLTRSSLVNTIIAGSGNIAPWYPLYRLGQQKKISNAFQDEVRIANRNADDAYDRFKQNPTRLNMLVSKYQDFNADLREAAAHYNNVNTGTFGQRLTNTGLFGGSSLVSIISQTVVQRQEVEDLQDIQEDMNRIARQIQGEVKRLQGGSATASASANAQQGQGSVQQRMMAMSVYGPRQG